MTATWRSVLKDAQAQLGPERRHEAKWLVQRAAGLDGSDYLLHLDSMPATRHLAYFDQMLARRRGGEPLQYVLGRWAFRTLDLLVDRRVLIPRPETEVVAGLAIDALAAWPLDSRRALDLGTGSGAIGLSLAAEVPGAYVWLTDRSPDALAVASANLAGMGGRAATRVTAVESDWFASLPPELAGTLAVIVSNPPYIAERTPLPSDVVDWEPSDALFAGVEGTDDLRHLVSTAGEWLAPAGSLVLELSPEQARSVAELAEARGFVDVRVENDLTGRARALVARRAGP